MTQPSTLPLRASAIDPTVAIDLLTDTGAKRLGTRDASGGARELVGPE